MSRTAKRCDRARIAQTLAAAALIVFGGACRVSCGADRGAPPPRLPSREPDDPNAHDRAQWQRGFEQATQTATPSVRPSPVAVGAAAGAIGGGTVVALVATAGDGGLPDATTRDMAPLPH